MSRWLSLLAVGALNVATVGCSGAKTSAPSKPSAVPQVADEFLMSARVVVEHGGIDTDALLAAEAQKAVDEGATPLRVVATGAAAEGDRVGGFVTVHDKSCLLAYARGTAEIEDLDIVTFDDQGASLTSDQSIGPNAAVVLCPPHPPRIYVAARVAAGQGLVALGVQGIAPDRAPAVAIKLGARLETREGEVLTQEAWPGLAGKITDRRRDLAGHWLELRRLSVPVSPRAASYVSTPLPGSRCLDVFVVPSEETRGLQVTIADDKGHILARGQDRGEDRVALICSPVDTTISVGIRPRRGHGMAAVVLSRSDKGAEAQLAIRPDTRRTGPMQALEPLRASTEQLLQKAGYGRMREVASQTVRIGETYSYKARLEPGCTRFDILAGQPVAGLRGALWSADDSLIAQDEGGDQLTLFGCTERASDVVAEVEGLGRPGPFVVEQRTESRVAPELQANPLAAARLLGVANSLGRVVPAKDLQSVTALALTETARGSVALDIPVGVCRDVAVALGPGATGVSVRAVDPSGKEVASTTGGTAATLQVCSDRARLRATAFVAVGAGAAKALVATLPIERH